MRAAAVIENGDAIEIRPNGAIHVAELRKGRRQPAVTSRERRPREIVIGIGGDGCAAQFDRLPVVLDGLGILTLLEECRADRVVRER